MVAAPALAAMLAWTFLVEPGSLRVRKVVVKTAKWPAGKAPLRIAVIADLHIGSPHNGLDALDRLVERTNALAPDLIVLLGDYVIHGVLFGKFVGPGPIAEGLGRLKARYGTTAILGNHDYLYDGAKMRHALEGVGIVVLEDEAQMLDTHGGRIWLAGLTDAVSQNPDIKAAFAAIPPSEPVIALSHDPALFPQLPDQAFLTLAGHTHGGQVNLPYLNPLATPGRKGVRYGQGAYREGKRLMYVSAGIGTSVLPARFNMSPEVLLIRLKNSTTAGTRDRQKETAEH